MSESKERRKRRRWGDAPSDPPINTSAPASAASVVPLDPKAKAAALQQSISARLAALKAKKAQAPSATNNNNTATANNTNYSTTTSNGEPPSKKAKVYDLDLSITGPTFRKPESSESQSVPKLNPYLAHRQTQPTTTNTAATTTKTNDILAANSISKSNATSNANDNNNNESEFLLDQRLAGGNIIKKRRSKQLKFAEPGTFIQRAERRRAKVLNATQSGFVSGRKTGAFVKATEMAHISHDNDGNSNSGDGASNYYGHTSAHTMQESDFQTMATRVPRVDCLHESKDGSSKSTAGVVVIPTPLVMEWWDVEFLPYKLKKQVVKLEGNATARKTVHRMKVVKVDTATNINDKEELQRQERQEVQAQEELITNCMKEASLTNCKTYSLIQHPIPVKPPNAPKDAPAPTLHLTKKEMKRQRKLRRAEKQRELQDLQAAGLIPAPDAKLTLSNFMRVLGDQAVMDPSKMEAKVTEQIQARRLKHEKMNLDRKLTKEQRSDKRERKLNEDTSEAVSVALFLVKDMSHRYHRTKVDLNAQQNKVTGGVLECENPKMCLVVAEGGPKAIKRYTRLMTCRMKWMGEGMLDIAESDNDNDGDGDGDGNNGVHNGGDGDDPEEQLQPQKFNPDNSCELVWTGMAPKRMFRTFVFQACETSDDARRVLEAKGVAHFWDQVVAHASGSGDNFHFKLGGGD